VQGKPGFETFQQEQFSYPTKNVTSYKEENLWKVSQPGFHTFQEEQFFKPTKNVSPHTKRRSCAWLRKFQQQQFFTVNQPSTVTCQQ